MAGRVCVAQIGGAHGIRGEVKLKSFTADPMAVKDYGPLTSEDGAASFEIEALRPAKGYLVARLRGVADRDTAERLARLRLFVPRERLPPPAPDEFYHVDLIGLAAVTADGAEFGTVVAVHDFGAGDILELRPRSGGTTIMVPFTEVFVPRVDLAAGRVTVVPPEVTQAKPRGE
ncbi:MAG TPA: ribosome maturation factor RimM [Xanthobacteraceae bacterium]